MKPTDGPKRADPDDDDEDESPRFEVPFLKTNQAKARYIARQQRARDRKVNRRQR